MELEFLAVELEFLAVELELLAVEGTAVQGNHKEVLLAV